MHGGGNVSKVTMIVFPFTTICEYCGSRIAQGVGGVVKDDKPYCSTAHAYQKPIKTHKGYIEIPITYYPNGVGPGGMDVQVMRAHAEACQRGYTNDMEVKSWVILYLLDCLTLLIEMRNFLQAARTLNILVALREDTDGEVLTFRELAGRKINTLDAMNIPALEDLQYYG